MGNEVRIPPIYGEDYEFQWGKVDYTGKVVLDIGCDFGSTADFFLRKGAFLVVCVDNNKEYIDKLYELRNKFFLPIIGLCLDMSDSSLWSKLINLYRPTVVKSDCEGCERALGKVPEEEIRKVPEYIIECHGDCIDILKEKFSKCNYILVDENPWAGRSATIIYWTKDVSLKNSR